MHNELNNFLLSFLVVVFIEGFVLLKLSAPKQCPVKDQMHLMSFKHKKVYKETNVIKRVSKICHIIT